VGDTFRRQIDITVPDSYALDKASQPAPGRLNYWLDLRAVDIEESPSSGMRRYRLGLDYQTFYVPLSPAPLTVPGLKLRFSSAGGPALEADIPRFNFVMAPLREIQPEKPDEGPTGYLKPDAIPQKISTISNRIGFGAGALAALLGFCLLAYHRAWWPFRARLHRPFTQAARVIKFNATKDDLEAYRTGLLTLHRAFDLSAGHRVLAEDVPVFLSEHREFQPLEEDIERFFTNSRRAFFGNDMAGAARVMPFASVAKLGSRLGEAERRAA
jgi:mxaA protein